MTSEDISYVTFTRGPSAMAGAKPRVGLTDAQKAGTACIICGGGDENVTEHIGYVNDVSVKIHRPCEGRWRYGE